MADNKLIRAVKRPNRRELFRMAGSALTPAKGGAGSVLSTVIEDSAAEILAEKKAAEIVLKGVQGISALIRIDPVDIDVTSHDLLHEIGQHFVPYRQLMEHKGRSIRLNNGALVTFDEFIASEMAKDDVKKFMTSADDTLAFIKDDVDFGKLTERFEFSWQLLSEEGEPDPDVTTGLFHGVKLAFSQEYEGYDLAATQQYMIAYSEAGHINTKDGALFYFHMDSLATSGKLLHGVPLPKGYEAMFRSLQCAMRYLPADVLEGKSFIGAHLDAKQLSMSVPKIDCPNLVLDIEKLAELPWETSPARALAQLTQNIDDAYDTFGRSLTRTIRLTAEESYLDVQSLPHMPEIENTKPEDQWKLGFLYADQMAEGSCVLQFTYNNAMWNGHTELREIIGCKKPFFGHQNEFFWDTKVKRTTVLNAWSAKADTIFNRVAALRTRVEYGSSLDAGTLVQDAVAAHAYDSFGAIRFH